jgi:hypothetical protein
MEAVGIQLLSEIVEVGDPIIAAGLDDPAGLGSDPIGRAAGPIGGKRRRKVRLVP